MWLRASMTILFLGLLFLSCGRINFLLVCSSYVSGDNRPCVAVRPTGQRKRFFWFITQNKPKTKMEKSTTFSCYLGSARSSRSIFEGKIIRWKIETIGCLWFMNCFRLKFCASFFFRRLGRFNGGGLFLLRLSPGRKEIFCFGCSPDRREIFIAHSIWASGFFFSSLEQEFMACWSVKTKLRPKSKRSVVNRARLSYSTSCSKARKRRKNTALEQVGSLIKW